MCRYNWHSAGSLGWPFPVPKYKYIFQIKYTEAILSNSTRKLIWFEITKMLIAVKKINLLCYLLYTFLHTFVPYWRKRLDCPPSSYYYTQFTPPGSTRQNCFVSRRPATANARPPYVTRRYGGTVSWWLAAERRSCRDAVSETGVQRTVRYEMLF